MVQPLAPRQAIEQQPPIGPRRITDSHLLSAVLRKQHVLNIVSGLSLARTGPRISYATSISIGDARAILAAAAQTLGGYFGQVP